MLFRDRKTEIAVRPMTRHTSIVTFMELNMILWTSYLLLMFCYDSHFLGDRHPVTSFVGVGCLAGAVLMFRRQLRLASWGANIRMSIATVIVFWTPVEILGRMDFFNEIWVEPQKYAMQMTIMLVAFVSLAGYMWIEASKKRKRG